MKRGCALLLVLVVLTALLGACTAGGEPTPTPTPTVEATASPTPAPTTPPDFADIDFSGDWAITAVFDSTGQAVSADQYGQMGANFTLELLKSGTYLIYNTERAPVGQGQYTVSQNQLILSAGGMQTTYIIQDANTLRCEAEDGSITVMTRCADIGQPEGEPETAQSETPPEAPPETEAPAESSDSGTAGA